MTIIKVFSKFPTVLKVVIKTDNLKARPRTLSKNPQHFLIHFMSKNRISDIIKKFKGVGSGSITLSNINKHTLLLSIDNQPKRNSISPNMMTQLSSCLDTIRTRLVGDTSLSTIVLKGQGASFCSGFDLTNVDQSVTKEQKKEFAADMSFLMVLLLLIVFGNWFWYKKSQNLNRLSNLPLISLALINSYAIGGGAELSTACDFRMMEKNAHIMFVHAKMGLTTGMYILLFFLLWHSVF